MASGTGVVRKFILTSIIAAVIECLADRIHP
jgi:hypothetical protein